MFDKRVRIQNMFKLFFSSTELGEAELREVVAARLGINGEAVLQNLIQNGKAELLMVEGVAYVRHKSYQWSNVTGLRCDQNVHRH